MAFPPEFDFKDEADFISRMLIPLLHRLGFSVVVNYHGNREFGKDLVFGEIDRFGHIRYHGLQAKYVSSIGQSEIKELVEDCQEAFTNPFRHPHTNVEERINTFYAVNGGSISDQGRTHFFNSIAHPYGGNVRLIDAKGVLALDLWAAANRSQTTLPDLNGLLLEIRFNRNLSRRIMQPLKKLLESQAGIESGRVMTNPLFPNRFRLNAASQYLQRPFFVDAIPAELIENYWEQVTLSNTMLDRCIGVTTVGVVIGNVKSVIEKVPSINNVGNELEERIRKGYSPAPCEI